MKKAYLPLLVLMLAGCDVVKVPEQLASKPVASIAAAPADAKSNDGQADAERQKQEAIAKAEAEARAHVNQAFSYIGSSKAATTKDAKEKLLLNAEIELNQALENNPNLVDAWLNRGVVFMALGKLNKAEEDLKKAISIDGKSSAAHYNLACLYSVMNKQDLAADALNAALQNGFSNIDSLRNDPDLSGLRKTKEFSQVLDKNKIFIK